MKTQITLRTVFSHSDKIFCSLWGAMVFTKQKAAKEMVSDISARQLASLH
ncbi:hypothetical protein O9929_00365 [Vibrio lentus]|nr:hypothetical protein [Vibrio lentus]